MPDATSSPVAARAPASLLGRVYDELRVLLTAVMFLTRIPCPRWVGHDPAYLARSTVYFPVVGVIVGVAGGLVLLGAEAAWTPLVAAALSTAATVWLSGAFHEDALADAFDGFGGGWDRAQVLAIMKDSRIGSYGAVALVLVLAVKIGAVASLAGGDVSHAARVLVAAHVLGRWSSLPLIRWLPYVREDGAKSRPFAASVTTGSLVTASIIALTVVTLSLAPLGWTAVVAAIASALVVTALASRYFRRRIGGMTGDCLGAANQLVELATYLVLSSAWLRA